MIGDIELTTMCALFDGQDVLMINRVKSWKGWAFPGGHLEPNESINDCVRREMLEETGVAIQDPVFKGITDIFNTVTHKRYLVYNFACYEYTGTVRACCDEGELRWVGRSEIQTLPLAEGMEYRLPLFFDDGRCELYIECGGKDVYSKVDYHIM